MTESFRRQAFAAGDADALAAFCVAQGGPYDAGLVKQLLRELTSDPAGVVVLHDADGLALVATVIDRVRNGADAASLETLGVRVPVPAGIFTRLVLEPAVAFARSGERRALHVPLQPSRLPTTDAQRVLRAAGFERAYDTFEMRRPASAPPPPAPDPLPAGWRWTQLDGARVDEAHAALVAMFRDAPATNIIPVEDFRTAVASAAARWRALLDGDRIAGLVRAIPHGDTGEVRILGRLPAYRGRGLGPRLLAEGLRVLDEANVIGDVELSVEAANEQALDLYHRFGFKILTRTPVFALPLRG
jgi:ribosomal protein S18 acetylase RimI-like enzyme